jgi:hypothetical protein
VRDSDGTSILTEGPLTGAHLRRWSSLGAGTGARCSSSTCAAQSSLLAALAWLAVHDGYGQICSCFRKLAGGR